MEREYGLEGRVRELESGDKSRLFVIAGTSDSGKVDLALDLSMDLEDISLRYVNVPNPPEYALGSLADYRAELYHGLQRYLVYGEHYKKGQNIIVSHSLLDSFAWISYNTQRKIANGTLDYNKAQTESFASVMMGQILFDSFYADHIFFIDDPKSVEDEQILYRMRAMVDQFTIPYTILSNDPSERVEDCATIIRSYYG